MRHSLVEVQRPLCHWQPGLWALQEQQHQTGVVQGAVEVLRLGWTEGVLRLGEMDHLIGQNHLDCRSGSTLGSIPGSILD